MNKAPEAKAGDTAGALGPKARSRDGKALLVYTCGISALGLGLCAWSLAHLTPVPASLLFVALVIVAELTTSQGLAPQVSLSMSSAVVFATMLLFGPLPATLVGAAGGLFSTIMSTVGNRGRTLAPFWQRAAFNTAALSLSAGAAGGTYVLVGGNVGEVAALANVPAMVLAAAVLESTNALFVIFAVAIQTGVRPYRVWKGNVSWAVPIDILTMLVGGAGLALGYRIAGILGVGVFFLPIGTTIYAFRVHVARTRAQVAELENNIARRERVEQQLTKSLREKSLLLQEIHHRVKNNLQIISSLLYLQSKKLEDGRAQGMLKESESRIRSMALVHERLYQSADLTEIDFVQYIRSLATHLFRLYGVDPNVVGLEINGDPLSLGIDTAIPCGLIVHEVISNSLKHAFPDGRKGTVRVELRSAKDGKIVLLLGDDGTGLGSRIDVQKTESLGITLIRTLVDQLDGTLEVGGNIGTKYRIAITDSQRLEGGAG